jgi:hypothetical protein
MKTNPNEQIPGWGIDADSQNDPTYPMRRRDPDLPKGYHWDRPSQQPLDVEVLHSNERPDVTAVFGTSCPPAGLSGILRRFAFKFSESSYGHWVPLLLADRINMLEGVACDLRDGHIPNIFSEMGLVSDLKHQPVKLAVKSLAAGLIVGGVIAVLVKRNSKQRACDS